MRAINGNYWLYLKFQSAPGFLGRAMPGPIRALVANVLVSIRARLFRPGDADRRGGACGVGAVSIRARLFRPGDAGGRPCRRPWYRCFNPRPAF